MAKYRKKPVVIEATQWLGWDKGPHDLGVEEEPNTARQATGWITTLEGGHVVTPGDWIITGIKGEKYPVKDEIFRLTYEPVSAGENESDGN